MREGESEEVRKRAGERDLNNGVGLGARVDNRESIPLLLVRPSVDADRDRVDVHHRTAHVFIVECLLLMVHGLLFIVGCLLLSVECLLFRV